MNGSPASNLAAALVARFGEGAYDVFERAWDELPAVEAAALTYDWSFWAYPKQRAPSGAWRRWGFLTGRGFGKTKAASEEINDEVATSKEPMLILLLAQDEQSAIDIQVNGPSGLIATAPPWNRPTWEATSLQLVWPNGSRAYVRTPEVPGKIRGLEYHLAWLSELQSWPQSTRDEAYSNALLSTRLGETPRTIWDSTPRRRHPILKQLLAEAADDSTNVVVRGSTDDNPHLSSGYKDDLRRKYGGTAKGREELGGEMLEESEGALVKQVWIDKARRPKPDRIARKVLSIDPAITERKGSDTTGIILAGLGVDGQVLVLGDQSGKMSASTWAEKTIDTYFEEKCDYLIVETNKGGDMLRTVLKAFCFLRDIDVVLVGKDEKPKHNPKVVHVKEVFAKGAKEDRAQPAATAYEAGHISHVRGVDLTSLEDTLTTWEPSPSAKSPGDLDALAHVVNELLDLHVTNHDLKRGFPGIVEAQRQLAAPPKPAALSSAIFQQFGPIRGGRI